jgi:hypothetical protein
MSQHDAGLADQSEFTPGTGKNHAKNQQKKLKSKLKAEKGLLI